MPYPAFFVPIFDILLLSDPEATDTPKAVPFSNYFRRVARHRFICLATGLKIGCQVAADVA